jgi:hypothetical protein
MPVLKYKDPADGQWKPVPLASVLDLIRNSGDRMTGALLVPDATEPEQVVNKRQVEAMAVSPEEGDARYVQKNSAATLAALTVRSGGRVSELNVQNDGDYGPRVAFTDGAGTGAFLTLIGGQAVLAETRADAGATGNLKALAVGPANRDLDAVNLGYAQGLFKNWLWTVQSVRLDGTSWDGIIETPGLHKYLMLGSDPGGPGGGNYFYVLNISYANATFLQIALPYLAGPAAGSAIYMRGKYGGTLYAWGKLTLA